MFDGSLEGLLTSIFEVFERKTKDVNLVEEYRYRPSAFDRNIVISSNSEKANRVWKGLQKNISTSALRDFYQCFLSEQEGISQVLLDFACYVFNNPGKDIEQNFGDKNVLKVSQVSKQVYREKHRFEAFVRFKSTSDDIYFATGEPDFNILPLLINHFQKRYADQKWVIYDMKRNYGIFYDLFSVTTVTIDADELKHKLKKENQALSQTEKEFQKLWQVYFKSTNIESRKNTKLHLRHVPKRYWKYLVEKQVEL